MNHAPTTAARSHRRTPRVDLLRSHGLAVTDLGANVPAGDWGATVAMAGRGADPPLVGAGICATTAGHSQQVQAAILAIRAAAPVPVVVGGLAVSSQEAALRLGADAYSRSVVDALALFDDLATSAENHG